MLPFTFYSKRRRHEKMIRWDILHLQYNNQHVTKTRWHGYDADDGASRTCSYAICYCHCHCQGRTNASPCHDDRWQEGEGVKNELWLPAHSSLQPPTTDGVAVTRSFLSTCFLFDPFWSRVDLLPLLKLDLTLHLIC